MYLGLGPCSTHHSCPHFVQTRPLASRRMEMSHQVACPSAVMWNSGICSCDAVWPCCCDVASAAAELLTAPVSGKLLDAACSRVVVVLLVVVLVVVVVVVAVVIVVVVWVGRWIGGGG